MVWEVVQGLYVARRRPPSSWFATGVLTFAIAPSSDAGGLPGGGGGGGVEDHGGPASHKGPTSTAITLFRLRPAGSRPTPGGDSHEEEEDQADCVQELDLKRAAAVVQATMRQSGPSLSALLLPAADGPTDALMSVSGKQTAWGLVLAVSIAYLVQGPRLSLRASVEQLTTALGSNSWQLYVSENHKHELMMMAHDLGLRSSYSFFADAAALSVHLALALTFSVGVNLTNNRKRQAVKNWLLRTWPLQLSYIRQLLCGNLSLSP